MKFADQDQTARRMARTHEQKKKQYLIKAIQRHRSNLHDFYQDAEVVTRSPGLELRGAGPGATIQGRENPKAISETRLSQQHHMSKGNLDSLHASAH